MTATSTSAAAAAARKPRRPTPLASRGLPLVNSYTGFALVAWTVVLASSLAWTLHLVRSGIHELIIQTAQTTIEKDLAYRRWGSGHGGVYVPIDPSTPPNPYLATLPERDLTTPAGKRLTLMNPAYMIRQVYERASETGGVQGHITSTRPIRPENRPDEWERSALARFERGEEQVDSVQLLRGEPYLRYVRRFLVEESCLKCHAAQGYRLGDVRGAISISVPLAPYLAIQRRQTLPLKAAHLGLWLLGVTAILATERRSRQRKRESEREEQERRSLEQQLHHARRVESVGRLTGGIAHDLNNLLSPILGFSSVVLEELPPLDPLRPDLEEIQRAARGARDLTRRLLAFSRKQELRVEPVDVAEVVEGMRKMLGAMLGEDVRLVIELAEGMASVRADRAQLELVLLNLAANARDAMPRGGTLRISGREERLEAESAALALSPGQYMELVLEDDGMGMDEHTRERIFEPYFTTKEFGKGTGLGLSTVHGIVKQLGGAIAVASAEGCGTTIRILLPSTAASARRSVEPGLDLPRGGERVLVVEDDPAVLRFVTRALGGLGYQVLEASSPDAALRLAAGGTRPDVVVTDVIMPHMSGPELVRRLADAWPGLAVLLISGNPRGELGPDLGGTRPLWKPFTPLELACAVRRAIDEGRTPSRSA